MDDCNLIDIIFDTYICKTTGDVFTVLYEADNWEVSSDSIQMTGTSLVLENQTEGGVIVVDRDDFDRHFIQDKNPNYEMF